MKTDKEWEARARDLAYPFASDECYARAALQLGREMAAEARDVERAKWQDAERGLSDAYIRLRKLIPGSFDGLLPGDSVWSHTEACLRRLVGAADARAEEIARRLEEGGYLGCAGAAKIARSTIQRPKPVTATEVAMEMEEDRRQEHLRKAEAAIRADEREKIAARMREAGATEALIARTVSEPKTREQVLEEALRRISDCDPLGQMGVGSIAAEALEWKP